MSNISIMVASLPNYENLVVELYVDDEFLGLICEEIKGQVRLIIEKPVVISAPTMIEAIAAGLERLQNLG